MGFLSCDKAMGGIERALFRSLQQPAKPWDMETAYRVASEPSSRARPTRATAPGLASVSCASSSFCTAVDFNGRALTYDGSVWSAPALVGGAQGLRSVSCASSSFCAALDSTDFAVTYNGSSWTAPVVLGGGSDKLSCPAASFCAVVDFSGRALTFNGSA